jgi:hypothetical protein
MSMAGSASCAAAGTKASASVNAVAAAPRAKILLIMFRLPLVAVKAQFFWARRCGMRFAATSRNLISPSVKTRAAGSRRMS